jgi:hypothetical protein
MVKEMLAARSISVTHETIQQWGLKFGREFARRITTYDCFLLGPQPAKPTIVHVWKLVHDGRRDDHA